MQAADIANELCDCLIDRSYVFVFPKETANPHASYAAQYRRMKMKKVKRILAWIGLVLIALMYALTLVFALIQHPMSKNLLMAAIFCTIAVPVIIYAMELVTRNLRKKSEELRKEADTAYRASGETQGEPEESHEGAGESAEYSDESREK